MLAAEMWCCRAVLYSIISPALQGALSLCRMPDTQDCNATVKCKHTAVTGKLTHSPAASGQCNAVQCRAGWRTPHLLACAAVVEHDIGQRLHAVLVQRRDARAQVRLTAICRAEALIVARQVALPHEQGINTDLQCLLIAALLCAELAHQD